MNKTLRLIFIFLSIAILWQLIGLVVIFFNFQIPNFIYYSISINIIFFFFLFWWLIWYNCRIFFSLREILGIQQSKALHFSKTFIALLDDNDRIIWTSYNVDIFSQKIINKDASEIITDFNNFKELDDYSSNIKFLNNFYQVEYLKEHKTILFKDVSNIHLLNSENEKKQNVFGYIKIDDINLLLQSSSEKKEYQILSLVDETLQKWWKKEDIFFQNITNDLFFFITSKKVLDSFRKDEFSILEKIKNKGEKENLLLSVSFGIGVGNVNKRELENLAMLALNKAENRGGDQVAINVFGDTFYYYGNSKDVASNTSRVPIKKFTSLLMSYLKKLNNKKYKAFSNVIVMGHSFADYDAIASSIALAALSRSKGFESFVVLDFGEISEDVKKYLNELLGKDYIKRNILSPNKALKLINDKTLLFVVDTSDAKRVQNQKFLSKTKNIIVLDHHRPSGHMIENTIAKYIDSKSSSTSEIIVEILELSNNNSCLNNEELNLLYSGIILDTNHFKASKTGARTLSAAATLRYWGVDHNVAINLLKHNVDTTKKVYTAINNAKEIKKGIFITKVNESDEVEKHFLAQVADSLINLSGIDVAIALGVSDDKKYLVSARSNGKINVQIIMENWNGGGHFSAAATAINVGEYDSLDTLEKEIESYILKNKIGV